jgi:uncharacterized protein (DUF983 family)
MSAANCPVCGGTGERLGPPGAVTWHRCRACGCTYGQASAADDPMNAAAAVDINPRVVRAEVNGEFRRTGRAKA